MSTPSTSPFAIPDMLWVSPDGSVADRTPPHGDDTWVPVLFDGQVSRAVLPAPGEADYTDLDRYTDTLTRLSQVTRVHTYLSRLDAGHPWRHGLVPDRVRVLDSHVAAQGLRIAAGLADNAPTDILLVLLVVFPHEVQRPEFGWFAPDADPTAFGTYYLAPDGGLPPARPRFRAPQAVTEIGWTLRQVGIRGVVDRAAWNDLDGLARLARRALTEDLESAITIRALLDSAAVAEGTRALKVRTDNAAAYAAFAGEQLRPRLVPSLVKKVVADILGPAAIHYGQWLCPRPEPGTTGDRVRAAYQVMLGSNRDRVVAPLRAVLVARDLGEVVLVDGPRPHLLITRRPDLIATYSRAFLDDQDILRT